MMTRTSCCGAEWLTALTRPLEEPRHTPGRKLRIRKGLAHCRVGGKEHPPGRPGHNGRSFWCGREICEHAQCRTVLRRPLHRESPVRRGGAAGPGANTWNEWHDVAMADGEQSPVLLEPVRVRSRVALCPVKARRGKGLS